MNTFQRIRTGIEVGLRAIRNADNIEQISKNIDFMVESGEISEKEAKDNRSQLDIRNTSHDTAYNAVYQFMRKVSSGNDEIPVYGSPNRDFYIANMWRNEPILAGAIYSMTAKMTALSWRVEGRRNSAQKYAKLFSQAQHIGGYDWGGFIASVAQDFYTTDRGVFIETPRSGGLTTPITDLGHIDALCCSLTGNTQEPVDYVSDLTGQRIRFKPGEVMHFSSLPSTREEYVGAGFCAVSRALRAAKLLMGLHNYDAEKLNNLPPEGVAAVTGLTTDEFRDAIALWMSERRKNNSLTFPQVLWLIGSQPGAEVKVNFTGFSQLPESFNRVDVVTQYINTLALDFGVDTREFWPVSSGALGTASESEVQHLKAKGKGSGEFISITERQLNGELPEGVIFEYDTKDIDEDMVAATTAKAWIDAYLPLYTSKPSAGPGAKMGGQALNNPTGEDGPKLSLSQGSPSAIMKKEDSGSSEESDSIISKNDLLRLLADKGVIPDYLVKDSRTVIMDSDVHKEDGDPRDVTCYEWKSGVLKERRIAPIVIYTTPANVDLSKIDVSINKETLVDEEISSEEVPVVKRNITGKPIPDSEVERGANITKTTVRDENALWRETEGLQPHALTPDEVDNYKL